MGSKATQQCKTLRRPCSRRGHDGRAPSPTAVQEAKTGTYRRAHARASRRGLRCPIFVFRPGCPGFSKTGEEGSRGHPTTAGNFCRSPSTSNHLRGAADRGDNLVEPCYYHLWRNREREDDSGPAVLVRGWVRPSGWRFVLFLVLSPQSNRAGPRLKKTLG